MPRLRLRSGRCPRRCQPRQRLPDATRSPLCAALERAGCYYAGTKGGASPCVHSPPGHPRRSPSNATIRALPTRHSTFALTWQRWPPRARLRDDLVLLASELATNAILHSRSGHPARTFAVRATLYPGDYVSWVEVIDRGRHMDADEHDHEHGRGLAIVAAIAGDGNWGIDGDAASRAARLNGAKHVVTLSR